MGDIVTFDNIRKDHSEIIAKIPDLFYPALLGELVAVFGTYILDRRTIKCCGMSTGTSGWYVALYATCDKLDMEWLRDYYINLEWYDADYLDGLIEEKCIELCKKKYDITNREKHFTYYKKLLNTYMEVVEDNLHRETAEEQA